MKTRKTLIFALPFLFILMLGACDRRNNLEISNSSNYVKIYIPQSVDTPNKKNIYVEDSTQIVKYNAYFGGPASPNKDIKVKFGVDAALVDSFNLKHGTDYSIMPEDSYKLKNRSAVIPAGKLSTPLMEIVLNTAEHMQVDQSYLLPVTITNVSGNYKVSKQLRTVFFLFTGGFPPGQVIHWNKFNAILPFSNGWIVRKPDGSLLYYPRDKAGDFGPPSEVGEDWDQYDLVMNYDSSIITRKPNGNLYSFVVDNKGNIGKARQIGSGWNNYVAITTLGHSLAGVTTGDRGLWGYPFDANGKVNKQGGQQFGWGWMNLDPLIGTSNALIVRTPKGVVTRYGLASYWAFGDIHQIATGWDKFTMVFYYNHALITRKPDGTLWRYPLDANGNLGNPKQIGG